MQLQVIEDIATFTDGLAFNEGEVVVSMADTLTIQNNSGENLNSVCKTIPLHSIDVFVFEVVISLLTASEDGGFGLILGWDGSSVNNSMNNFLRLLLDQNGRFSIDFIHDGKNEQVTVQQSAFINTGMAANKITVHKSRDEINFLINDNMVFTVECNLFGPQFWILLGPLTTISVDSFHFAVEESAPPPPPIPSITTLHSGQDQLMYNSTARQRPKRKRGRNFFIFLLFALVIYLLYYITARTNHRTQYRNYQQITPTPERQGTMRAMEALADSIKK